MPHHGASVPLSAADVHEHEERRDEQGHASWHHLDRYQESDERGDSQEGGGQIDVHEEWSRASLQNEGEPASGEGLICIR